MKKLLSTSVLLLATAFCNAQTSQPDFSKVRSLISNAIQNSNVPSISIAVVKGNKILWEESFGYADKEQQRKATVHTPYYLASISKTLTATALMKLAERKMIDLDGPVNKYMRYTKVSSNMWDPDLVTVKHVMTHTSGLTTYGFGCTQDSATCVANESTIINRYAVLVQPPGAGFDYSNLGYGVLDKVIRDVSGKTFTAYMQQEIFQPLNMTNTFVMNGGRSDRAIRYSAADLKPAEYGTSYSFTPGASNIYGSVHDLSLFAMMHLNTLKARSKIISTNSIALMQDTIARVSNGQHYGLGWWITDNYNGYKGLLAQGGTYYAQAWLQLIPSEEIGIVILTNTGHGGLWRPMIDEVLSELLPKFKENRIAAENAPKKEATPATPVTTAGKWEGIVQTYKGDIPLILTVSESGEGIVTLDKETITVPKVRVSLKHISYNIEGDLGLDDVGPGPYTLRFYLTREADLLYGHVETQGTAQRPATQQLSYWVKLKSVQ